MGLAAWRRRMFFEAATEGAAGAAAPAEGATEGAPPATEGGEGAPPPATGPAWWEDKRFAGETRQQLEALGLTVEDPLDAVARLSKMERDAKKKFGKSPDQLMDRPQAGKEAEWIKANAALLGIPEAPDKYELARPEGWPKDAPWDDKLEAAARAKGHELGLSQAQMQGMSALYAEHVAGLLGSAEAKAGDASAALRTALQADWGDKYEAKVAQAQMAASAVAEAAGIDGDGLKALGDLLATKVGDPQTLKLFAAIGEMMGEDTLKLSKGTGNTLGTTPADARAELQAMIAPGSDYQKAAELKRQGRPSPEFERLQKRYQELNRLAAQR